MPAAFKRSQAASQACADRSLTTTFAPARPSARAMAYPSPRAAPVTSATRPQPEGLVQIIILQAMSPCMEPTPKRYALPAGTRQRTGKAGSTLPRWGGAPYLTPLPRG